MVDANLKTSYPSGDSIERTIDSINTFSSSLNRSVYKKLSVRVFDIGNPALISAEDYEQLLDLNNRLTQPAARTLLLRK